MPAKILSQADSSKADMAGMDMLAETTSSGGDSAKNPPKAEVTLTAAQVQHGGVLWERVAIGSASGAVTVPGQLVPNEDRTARLGATARGGPLVVVPVLLVLSNVMMSRIAGGNGAG